MTSRRTMPGAVIAFVAAAAIAAAAQIGGKPSTGNPTPGTAQPLPPNLGDRVTLTGCLQPAPPGRAATAPRDANSPTDARAVLTNAEKIDRVPPGTGGSALAMKASSRTYRLAGLDSQFSPFMNTKVEISGEVTLPPSIDGAGPVVPTLIVEFVQRIGARC